MYTGVFIARGREDALVTKNLVPGEAVYGEKKISVEASHLLLYCTCSRTALLIIPPAPFQEASNTPGETTKVEYRVWNPFRSKLAAAILGGIEKIHIKPGSKVLYLGAASGTTVSHVADIVGPVMIISYESSD